MSITLNKMDKHSFYRRESTDEIVEKVLLDLPEGVVLNPVEPLNTPKKISPYLLIEFSKTAVVSPQSTKAIFLKFPVEVGIFIPKGGENDLLDLISLSRKKYTLYGTPRGGHVCRYWQSDVFAGVPDTDPLYEGVLRLEISNTADEWIHVKRSVLDVHGMKIHYKVGLVSANAKMTVLSGNKAETEFKDSSLEKGMKSSMKLFRLGKLAVTSSRYYMGEGI